MIEPSLITSYGRTRSATAHPLQGDLDEVLLHTKQSVWRALQNQSIFLTGGTGFVGKWLLEALIHANRQFDLNVSVAVLTRNSHEFARKHPHLALAPNVELVAGDLHTAIFPKRRFDGCIHAAFLVAPPSPNTTAAALYASANAATRRLLAYVLSCGAKRLLYVSSGAVYGDQPELSGSIEEARPIDETQTSSPYAQAKRLDEQACLDAQSLDCVIARCFAFLGPYLTTGSGSAAAQFISAAAAQQPVEIHGNGKTVRSYQYASDMARWLLTLYALGHRGLICNVGSDEPHTIHALATSIANAASPPVPVIRRSQSTSALAGQFYVPQVSLAVRELDLSNLVEFEDAIRRCLAFAAYNAAAATIPT